jgi:hypothetical protein
MTGVRADILTQGWTGVRLESNSAGEPVARVPHELASTAMEAWYDAVAAHEYEGKESLCDEQWEACRAAVADEAITLEQLAILLRLAGPKPSPQSSSLAGPTG